MIALNALTRLCAAPCQVKDIDSAKALAVESGLTLYDTRVGQISRAAITGLLVSWEANEDGSGAGILDDGTGRILIRSTQRRPEQSPLELDSCPLGSIVFCIGRVRTLGEERYVSIETAHVLHDTYWLTYRKFEIALFRESANPAPARRAQSVREPSPTVSEREEWRDRLLAAVRLLDTGDGADVSLILKQTSQEDDTLIQKLIRDGDIYEIKPGKVKTLD